MEALSNIDSPLASARRYYHTLGACRLSGRWQSPAALGSTTLSAFVAAVVGPLLAFHYDKPSRDCDDVRFRAALQRHYDAAAAAAAGAAHLRSGAMCLFRATKPADGRTREPLLFVG